MRAAPRSPPSADPPRPASGCISYQGGPIALVVLASVRVELRRVDRHQLTGELSVEARRLVQSDVLTLRERPAVLGCAMRMSTTSDSAGLAVAGVPTYSADRPKQRRWLNLR